MFEAYADVRGAALPVDACLGRRACAPAAPCAGTGLAASGRAVPVRPCGARCRAGTQIPTVRAGPGAGCRDGRAAVRPARGPGPSRRRLPRWARGRAWRPSGRLRPAHARPEAHGHGTRRATPWRGASVGLNAGGAWLPARPVRASFAGFPVSGGRWARTACNAQPNLGGRPCAQKAPLRSCTAPQDQAPGLKP